MNSDKGRQITVIIGLVSVIVFNFVSQAIPLGGATSAEIANRIPDMLYFPANYAFSIWGVIYAFLIAYGVFQALPRNAANPALRRTGWLFVLSCVFNIGWLTSFHFNLFPLSMVMMLLLLGTLITIYIRLGIGVTAVSTGMKWCVHIPFSIYIGWITAATITNAGYVLRDAGWDGFGIADQTWAVIMLVITGILSVAMVVLRRDVAYGLLIIWAVGAIAVRHADIAPVQLAALAVCAVTVAAIIYTILRLTGRLSSPTTTLVQVS